MVSSTPSTVRLPVTCARPIHGRAQACFVRRASAAASEVRSRRPKAVLSPVLAAGRCGGVWARRHTGGRAARGPAQRACRLAGAGSATASNDRVRTSVGYLTAWVCSHIYPLALWHERVHAGCAPCSPAWRRRRQQQLPSWCLCSTNFSGQKRKGLRRPSFRALRRDQVL